MHPYFSHLEGQDVSDFSDPNGKYLFNEFVEVVERDGDGYVNYMWQWKDDTSRIVPKLSYVKGFEPWGWIIGTGVYLEDVKEEVAEIQKKLNFAFIGILGILLVISLYIII